MCGRCALVLQLIFFIFFFQAEDGIRDDLVTGAQTCALPISPLEERTILHGEFDPGSGRTLAARLTHASRARTRASALGKEIGRASCRERVEGGGGVGGCKEKK